MKDTADDKQEIKDLYLQTLNKTDLQIKLAENFNVEPSTVRNHWFGPFLSVPKKNIKPVIMFIREYNSCIHE